jgi:oligopeptide transport system substrate-binding protein
MSFIQFKRSKDLIKCYLAKIWGHAKYLIDYNDFCCSSCSKIEQKEKKNLLPISMSTEVRSLDPGIGIDDSSQVILRMLFEGLMTLDLSGNLVPAAAERYEVSSDLKTYTFFLRDSKWSNGIPVTAHDFEYSWKRVIGWNTKGAAVHNYYPIKNVQSFVQKKTSLDEVGIKALNAKTLQIELEHPTPYFLEIISTSSFFPINAELDKKNLIG